MSQSTHYIPAGYHAATPYFSFKDSAVAIAFYEKAFGAVEEVRMPGPGGRIGHAEIRIGDSHIMLADESPTCGNKSAQTLGDCPISMVLYVENVDVLFVQALAAGAIAVSPIEDKFYGDRMGSLKDPFGYTWHIATHIRDVSPEEMREKAQEMATQAVK